MRLLFTLSSIYGSSGDIENSILILDYLKDILPGTVSEDDLRLRMTVKIMSLLTYNYFRMGKDEETIKYADIGIEICLSNYIFEHLDILYFRKGIAMYMLKQDDYKEYLKKALYILYSTDNMSRYNTYIKALKENYNLEINMLEE